MECLAEFIHDNRPQRGHIIIEKPQCNMISRPQRGRTVYHASNDNNSTNSIHQNVQKIFNPFRWIQIFLSINVASRWDA